MNFIRSDPLPLDLGKEYCPTRRDVVRMRFFSYFSSYLWRRLLAIIVKEELTYWIQFDVLSDLTVEFNFNLTIPS